jgi:hypothetical protein
VAKKRSKSGKSKTRKKVAAAGAKKKRRRRASPPHYDYELNQNFQAALKKVSTDVQTILGKFDENDANAAPTEGILKRIKALIFETTKGNLARPAHENRIERILYAIGGMNDQYYINKSRPPTQAYPPPTGGMHEDRVLRLCTTVNNICRDVFSILQPGTMLKVPPRPAGNNTNDIVAMAQDTQMVVDNILSDIVNHHLDSTSK